MAIDGGDLWSGARLSRDELDTLVDVACSTVIASPIIPQYYPARGWLWRQWGGTIVRRVLPEVLLNILFAIGVACFFRAPGPQFTWRLSLAEGTLLAGVSKVWALSATMATFTLSFFLSQSYSLWRSVYSICRRVQGRLNDVSLLCATFAERDSETGTYTAEAEAMLATVARYVRLFHMLFYASVTTRFAALKTPNGLEGLVK